MLFSKPVKDVQDVKREVHKIVGRQKPGSKDDLSLFKHEIEELLSSFSEFHPEWAKSPAVFRVARMDGGAFIDNVVLPNVKHDLELMVKMLNHMREQKGLPQVRMPLFVQPDEIALARREGRADLAGSDIISQLAIVFQKGAVMWIGFVFGRDYVLLQG